MSRGYYWELKINLQHKGYDPSQPRVPAGDSRGGQWTSAHGGSDTVFIGTPTQDQFDEWDRQIKKEWDGARGGMAYAAIHAAKTLGYKAMVIAEGDKLKAVAALYDPEGEYSFLTGEMEPPSPGSQMSCIYAASKEKGYGTRLIRGSMKRAADNDWGFVFSATDKSKPFYLKIGLRPTSEDSTLFSLSPEEVKQWLKTGKM